MTFYPFGILSMVLLGIAYAVMLLIYGFIWWISSAMKARSVARLLSAFVLLLVPVGEELWIASNFGGACRNAGTVIHKTATTDGFYDDVFPWRERRLAASKYRFVESRDRIANILLRAERRGSHIEVSKIERPSARYHFRSRSHIPQEHKVFKHESTIEDATTREVLAEAISYTRHAPWFFVGLDSPVIVCGAMKSSKGLLYEKVLLPKE